MTVNIKKGTKIAAFQAAFTQALPGLKPVFFHRAEETEGTWSGYVVLNLNMPLAVLGDDLPDYETCVVCDAHTTAARFEREMYQKYGLVVRVFKQYLGDWVALSATEQAVPLEAASAKAIAAVRVVEDVIL